MKIATSFFAGVLFIGTMGVINTAIADDSIASEADLTPDSYCHKKFPAIKESTFHYVQPVLKDSKTSGDVIDFYGPCDEDPQGKDQVWEQRIEELHWIFKH